jgi:hypothetical protein
MVGAKCIQEFNIIIIFVNACLTRGYEMPGHQVHPTVSYIDTNISRNFGWTKFRRSEKKIPSRSQSCWRSSLEMSVDALSKCNFAPIAITLWQTFRVKVQGHGEGHGQGSRSGLGSRPWVRGQGSGPGSWSEVRVKASGYLTSRFTNVAPIERR